MDRTVENLLAVSKRIEELTQALAAQRKRIRELRQDLAAQRAVADLLGEAEGRPRIEAAEAEAAASILLRAYGEWKDHKFPLCHESRSNYEKVLMRAGPALARYVLATRPRPASGSGEEVRRGE